MIRIRHILVALVAAPLFTLPHQVFASDATGTASATVIAPIAVTQSTAMEFGSIAPTAAAGSIVMATDGTRSATNVDILAGTSAAAAFGVTGSGTQSYSVSLPSSAITLSDGANSMTVDAFDHDAGATPALAGGVGSFNVGATLNVGANQAA